MASSVKVSQIASILPSGVGYGNLFLRAKQVATTLECFIASADIELCVDHVPRERSMVRHTLKVPFNNQEKANILREASAVWERMSDPTDKDVCIPHDGYLKVFQLQRPLLEQYDCIMMDESQDSTPAMADVVLRQTCAKIFVGDPHQKIYGFRGAINSLNTITDAATFYLTQSFRFGPEISYVASCLLEKMKGETRKTLVGGAQAG
ncbi:PREDICTED: F-box DNA helicase 1-like [Priapulus caudatus]|uniref:F-box DNA helicase 1-like n=1 Tax=Priapulus caudatus TaxID=37621 RepID=A0ABM1EX68_PRICU|nr:PREDICTED: F-box DNA helicase 1-like [Priapulus caudatus]